MISVTILVKNGARHIKEVLEAVSGFQEIILYDTGSQDNTLNIAQQFPRVTIYQKPFIGFGPTRNQAAHLAKFDWILSIDADEVLSKELIEELNQLQPKPDHLYAIPFLNFYKKKQIKWCGWYPEKHIRLYHRKKTSFSESMVHEGVIQTPDMTEMTLKNPIYHYSYNSISDFLVKMERYSTLFAAQYNHKRNSSPLIALGHGFAAFMKSYFLKRGFMGGFEGFLISSYNAHTAFYKYLKLYESNKE